MNILERILAFAASLASSAAAVWVAGKAALRLEAVSRPNPLVQTHTKPVPYLGGVAVFFVWGVILVIFQGFKTWVLLLTLATWFISIFGTVDDLCPLRWWLKLGVEFVVVSVFLPLYVTSLGLPLNVPVIIAGVVVIVVLTNGFNLIDVSDGLASGVGGVIAIGLTAAFFFYSERSYLSLAPLILLAALAGFLVFNWPTARIYLGDGGSLPLGFVLGTLTFLWVCERGFRVERLIVGLSMSSLVLFELALVCFHRIRKGKSIFRGSPDHFALRLVRMGWSTTKVLLVSLAVAVFLVLSLALMWLPWYFMWIYAGLLLTFYAISFLRLSRVKVDG